MGNMSSEYVSNIPSRKIIRKQVSKWRFWTRQHLHEIAQIEFYRKHVSKSQDSPRARDHYGIPLTAKVW